MTGYGRIFNSQKTAVVIPFFVIGDPDFQTSLELVRAALDAGADILELGIPFSDPIADGQTIQKADIRALSAGMTPSKALEFIKKVTEYKPVPIGLLVYYNLIYRYGTEKFLADFKAAGGTSVLVADLSIDDADEIALPAKKAGLETVFMVTPNTTQERAKRIAEKTTGFIYAVSTLGVTGAREVLSETVKPLIKKLKQISSVPVCVGFGISTPEQAAEVAAAGADGVIIGSRIVKIIEQNPADKKAMTTQIADFISKTKKAIQKYPLQSSKLPPVKS